MFSTRLSEAGLALAQLILAQDVDIPLRQISSFSSCRNVRLLILDVA
jgi:hypothetical protein